MPDSHAPAFASGAAEPDLGYRAKGFYYGGKWEAPATSNTFVSTSPSTGKLLAEVPLAGVNANPISDTQAVAAARDVLATLPLLMKDLKNPDLRSRMSLAALKAGLAFSNTKTALAHSISYDMTLNHGLPHGIACSFTLPMVLGRAVGADPQRDAVLAQIFDGALRDAPVRLEAFLASVGVSTDFASYGVDKAEADAMIHKALDGVRGKNFIGVARPSA